MNKGELKYIKENYYNETNVLSSLLETISKVIEVEKTNMANKLIREQAEGSMLTLESIPEISVTELGWTDVRTVGNQEVSGPARNQLLQFTKNIKGTELQEKIASLADFYNNPDSVNLEGGTPGQKIANALSLSCVLQDLNKSYFKL